MIKKYNKSSNKSPYDHLLHGFMPKCLLTWYNIIIKFCYVLMTSQRNTFHLTGHLWGGSADHQRNALTKFQQCRTLIFFPKLDQNNCWKKTTKLPEIWDIMTLMWHCYSISQEICTRFCCALLCCGYVIIHNEFKWYIYPYSSGLLCWHWGNTDCHSVSEVSLMDMGKSVNV